MCNLPSPLLGCGLQVASHRRLLRCRGASNVGVLVAWAGQELGKQVVEARLRLGEHPDSPSTCAALESALKRLLAALAQGEFSGLLSCACDGARARRGEQSASARPWSKPSSAC